MTTATNPAPGTKVDEIAAGIYRMSTFVPEVSPTGFTFNQFLLLDEEPLLFHTGHRSMFPSVAEAITRLVPLDRLRWITFGHVESDECGAMNLLLDAAPHAQVAHGAMGCAQLRTADAEAGTAVGALSDETVGHAAVRAKQGASLPKQGPGNTRAASASPR